jgi:histidine phosphotransferase ChpT
MSEIPNVPPAWETPGTESAASPAPPAGPHDLAAQLAARLCHDFISPASAIVSGLDLLDDPSAADMREDAMSLIAGSARKLVAILAFARVAFGSSASAESFDARELERLARGVYEHVRPELDWQVEPASLNKASARALLNLAQLGASALPTGGVARVSAVEQDGLLLIAVEAQGPRVRMRPEVLEGLRGEPLGEGLGGHWVQAYYVHALLTAAGGTIGIDKSDERMSLTARVPLAG